MKNYSDKGTESPLEKTGKKENWIYYLQDFDRATYDSTSDILYLTTKARRLLGEGKRANIEAYSERTREIQEKRNPDLDTRQYFKDYCIRQYNTHIAGSAEECLSIAFSLCAEYPKSCSSMAGADELIACLAVSLIPMYNLRRVASVLSEITTNLGADQEVLQIITQLRYELFCLK